MRYFPYTINGVPALVLAANKSAAHKLVYGCDFLSATKLDADDPEQAAIISRMVGHVNRNRLVSQNNRSLDVIMLVPQALNNPGE